MTTTLERVAECQYGVLRAASGGRLPTWATLDDEARELMLNQVRAGLEAMRGAGVTEWAAAALHEKAGRIGWPTEYECGCLDTVLAAILAEAPK